tara:strand:- start:6165 stop:6386 length:222 start_codon:yes stop_codon:yes gene_type:complete
MKFWESPIIKTLGWKEEPKGVAKVMSVCMLIVIVAAYFLPTSIQEIKLVSTIIWGSIIIFFMLLAYVIIKRFL